MRESMSLNIEDIKIEYDIIRKKSCNIKISD